jgi:hypothetical protein
MTINRLNQDVTYLPAFRNLIINGAMQVAQRGTSTTGITGTGYYTADRWRYAVVTQGTWTQTLENDAPTGSGFRNSTKVLCTTADAAPAAADLIQFNERIEGQNLQAIRKGTSSAQQLTASFWVKSNVTGTYIAELLDVDNTRQISAAYSIASSGTWEKKTIVFPADTTGAFDNDNNDSLRLIFWLGAGTDFTSGTLNTSWASTTNANRAVGQTNLAAATNNYWQITGVQLEVGAVATPFEFKPIEQELAECQRYYWRNTTGNTFGAIALGFATTTTAGAVLVSFPVAMRAKPTSIDSSNLAVTDFVGFSNSASAISLTVNEETSLIAKISFTSTGLTAYRPLALRSDNNVNGYLGFSAEL